MTNSEAFPTCGRLKDSGAVETVTLVTIVTDACALTVAGPTRCVVMTMQGLALGGLVGHTHAEISAVFTQPFITNLKGNGNVEK